jgi:hypothetical protein
MKKIIKQSIVTAAFMLSVFVIPQASAQTFFGLLSLSGTNYAPILLHFAVQSNQCPVAIQSQTLVVTNIYTNEQIILTYGTQPTGVAGTNLLTLTTLTTNFTGANGWTIFPTNWTFAIPGSTYYPSLSPWGSLGISSNGVSFAWTNGVGLQ